MYKKCYIYVTMNNLLIKISFIQKLHINSVSVVNKINERKFKTEMHVHVQKNL